MIEFKTLEVQGEKKRICIISSGTPPKTGIFFDMNRQQRRAMVYAQPVERLMYKIEKLRKTMREAGIKGNELPAMPKFNSRKVLSGYMSELKELFRNYLAFQQVLSALEGEPVEEGW